MRKRLIIGLFALIICLSLGVSQVIAADEAVLGNNRWRIESDGDFVNQGAYDIGSSTTPVENLYVDNIYTADRDAATGYEYMLTIDNDITGTGLSGKTYGLNVDMSRPVTSDTTVGDIDDAGIKVRVDNYADTNTAGNTLRAIDAQSRQRSTGNTSNIIGGTISAQTDSGGTTAVAKGLEVYTTLNGTVTTTLKALDTRLFRQSAGEPTTEYIAHLRCSNTSGSGADAALVIESDYTGSASTDSIDNGIVMSGAAINQADIVGSAGAKIFTGDAANGDAVYAEVGSYDAKGSIYLSTAAGAIYVQVADAGASADWYKVTSTDAD